MATNDAWIERQTRDDESRRLYEEERLVACAAEEIAHALEHSGMSRADLARALGTSRAYITRVLQGSANLTLRSLADLASAANCRVSLSFEPLSKAPVQSASAGGARQRGRARRVAEHGPD